MRLYVISDLHLEENPGWAFPSELPAYDVAVVAGDLHSPMTRSIAFAGTHPVLSQKPLIFVPGNHEFDKCLDMAALLRDCRKMATNFPNVHLLSQNNVEIGNVRFVGVTLWTDYALYGTRRASMNWAAGLMPDHQDIWVIDEETKESRTFNPNDALIAHKQDLAYLNDTLEFHHNGPTVVVTHHMPSEKSVAPWYRGNALTPAFASNLEEFIERHKPELWIHGHGHWGCDYVIGQTRIVANPKGYGPYPNTPKIENANFNAHKIVEIDDGSSR